MILALNSIPLAYQGPDGARARVAPVEIPPSTSRVCPSRNGWTAPSRRTRTASPTRQQALDGRAHSGIVINGEHYGSACGRHSRASTLAGRVK